MTTVVEDRTSQGGLSYLVDVTCHAVQTDHPVVSRGLPRPRHDGIVHPSAIIGESLPSPPGLHREWKETTATTANLSSSSSLAYAEATNGRRSRRSRRGGGGGSPRSKRTNTIVGQLAYFTIACHLLADDSNDDGGGGGGGGGVGAKRHCNQLTRALEG